MGHTNSTTNLHLPQFVGSDKPTWLSDVNGAMLSIDQAYGRIENDSAAAVTAADGAVTTANGAASTASSAASTAATAASNASTALSTANNAASTATSADTKATTALSTTPRGSVSVTADGVKTIAQLMNELFALSGTDNVTERSVITQITTSGLTVYQVTSKSASEIKAMTARATGAGYLYIELLTLSNDSKKYDYTITSSISSSDASSEVPTSGIEFAIEY